MCLSQHFEMILKWTINKICFFPSTFFVIFNLLMSCLCFWPDKNHSLMSTEGKSTNVFWQESSVGRLERQKLLQQKGCVVWITGLSGSGLQMELSNLKCRTNIDVQLLMLFNRPNIKMVIIISISEYTLDPFNFLMSWMWSFVFGG